MGADGDPDRDRVLRVAEDVDPASLPLSPAEGFLLSRIDGRTSWRLLREIGGMTPEEVDLCLEGWISRGILVAEAVGTGGRGARAEARATGTRAQAARPRGPRRIDESLLDSELDLPVGTQKRILEMELGLDRPYHELLGVAPDADARAIKRAYFKLSKEFHPDRYFRRKVGPYADRLSRIFKKVLEAYELLSDPIARAEMERSMAGAPTPPETEAPEREAAAEAGAPPPRRPLTKLERLQQRMPFRIPHKVLNERREKAATFFAAAREAARRRQFMEATSSARLAIAFDPWNAEYKQALGEMRAQAAERRAAELLAKDAAAGGGKVEHSELSEALRLVEETLLYRPHDPALNHQAAALALQLEEPERAFEYAERALEHSPEVALYHRTMGAVHRARGARGHAVKELEKALELDPHDHESRKLLTSLRRRGER